MDNYRADLENTITLREFVPSHYPRNETESETEVASGAKIANNGTCNDTPKRYTRVGIL
jgi:hypothetical protein